MEHVNEQLIHMRVNARELHTKLATSSLVGAGCLSYDPSISSQVYQLIISLLLPAETTQLSPCRLCSLVTHIVLPYKIFTGNVLLLPFFAIT